MNIREYREALNLQLQARTLFKDMPRLLDHPLQMIENRITHHRDNRKILAYETIGKFLEKDVEHLLKGCHIHPRTLLSWLDAAWRYARENRDGEQATLIEPVFQRILEAIGIDCQDTLSGLLPGSWTGPLHARPEGRLPVWALPQDTPDVIFTTSDGCAWLDEITIDEGQSLSGFWDNELHSLRLTLPLDGAMSEIDARKALQGLTTRNNRLGCHIMGHPVDLGSIQRIKATSANLIVDLKSEAPIQMRCNPDATATNSGIGSTSLDSGCNLLSCVYEPRTTMWSQALITISERDTTRGRTIWASIDRDPSVPKGLNEVPSIRFDHHSWKWWVNLSNASLETLEAIARTYPAATIIDHDGATAHVRANRESWDPNAVIEIHPVLIALFAAHRVPIQDAYLLTCEKYANGIAIGEQTKWPRCGGTRQNPFFLPDTFPAISFRRIDQRLVIEDLELTESGIRVHQTTGRLVFTIPPGTEHGPFDVGALIGDVLGIDWLPDMPITSVKTGARGRTLVEAYAFPEIVPVSYEPERQGYHSSSTEVSSYHRSLICRAAVECADHALANDANVAAQMKDSLHEIDNLCGDDLGKEVVRICLHNVTNHVKYDKFKAAFTPLTTSKDDATKESNKSIDLLKSGE